MRRRTAMLFLLVGCGLGACAEPDTVTTSAVAAPPVETTTAPAAGPAAAPAPEPTTTTEAPPPTLPPPTTPPATIARLAAAPQPVPTAPPAPAPVVEEPVPVAASGCHPSYPGVCIPPAPPDLDCADVSYRRFTVVGTDPHGFDADYDGIGCESG